MSLFAVLGIPCLTILLLLADGKSPSTGSGAPNRESPALQFVKGFLYAVPCLVAMYLVRRYVPVSYRGFPLYLLFLVTDHLIPALFLGVLYFLVYPQKTYGSLLSFGGGFYTMVGIVDIFVNFGQFEPYHLFLLPAIRMAGLLFFTIFFLRFEEWYGLVRALFLILLIAVPFLSGAVTFLYMKAYLFWAAVLTALYFLGSVSYTYIERKA